MTDGLSEAYETKQWDVFCENNDLRLDNDELRAENAKLRELVELMTRRFAPISPCKNIPCGECPVKDECDKEDELMRELGVEVDK